MLNTFNTANARLRFKPLACLLHLTLLAGTAPFLAGTAILGLTAGVPTVAHAAPVNLPFLSPMFSDNMVLQRDRPIMVWGWAPTGTAVTVEMDGHSAATKADNSGKWTIKLPALPAGGPHTLAIRGPQTVTLNNVLMGDVWVCSGQSNMEMGIGNVNNAAQEIANANYPQIRLFTVTKDVAIEPRAVPVGKWDVCTPQTVAMGGWNGFSAVGYFFGRELYNNLKVPIGLIHTSWGGTPAEAWTSAQALEQKVPAYTPMVEQMAEVRTRMARGERPYSAMMTDWYIANDPGTAQVWNGLKFNDAGWQTANLPGAWEQSGVAEMANFDGVVWYRRTVELAEGEEGRQCILHLGPVDDRDTTWVNGRLVGAKELATDDRAYALPLGTLRTGKNEIAVRVLDTGGAGGFTGKPEQMVLEVTDGRKIPLNGEWKMKVGVALPQAKPLPVPMNNNPNFPTVLYNGMIAPLLGYGIKGAIWYQGESNAGKAYQYRTLLPTMITDWRNRWKEGDFPFYIVQLANWQQPNPTPVEDAWAELREAQLMTAQHLPNTGIAVTTDIGDAGDIHPKNKQDVGKRLALAALAKTYGEKIEYSGPEYKAMKVEGNKIRLTFAHVGGGLTTKNGEPLKGFAVAGDDHKFAWADAKIEGDSIVLSSLQVANPVAARYAWHINPVANLYNKAGLPASPFRTDTWPGITVNNK